MNKKNRSKELREKNIDELNTELLALLKSQFGLRMQKATQQLSNLSQLSQTRKDIARVRTILHQKKQQATKAAGNL